MVFPRRYCMRDGKLFIETKQLNGRITDKLVVAKLVHYSTPLLKNGS
jgi:hypothetical protein